MSKDANPLGAGVSATTEESAGPGISRRVVWSLAAGGSSTVVHLLLILILGLVVVSMPLRTSPMIMPQLMTERLPQELPERLQTEIRAVPPTKFLHSGGHTNGHPGLYDRSFSEVVRQPKMPSIDTNRATMVKVDVGITQVWSQTGSVICQATPNNTPGEVLAPVAGYGDAMDRITQEVLNQLAKRKVLLVWALDQSHSMEDDREEISMRIERVYQELGLSEAAKGDALLTGVTSYGAETKSPIDSPTSDPAKIMAAIRNVPNDPSGREMQCQAVAFAIASFSKLAVVSDRQMMVVLVTDESGDMNTNITQLEQAIAVAKAVNCRVYVLGRESIFGYPYAHMRYHHEDTKTNHWLRIDRGPETPWPEQLQIDGFHARNDAFPSGFGPYEQSRLARETGGIFFLLPSPEVNLVGRRADLVYDGDAMRPYLPSLQSREQYVYERDQSPLRSTVWKVIIDLNPYDKTHGSRIGVRTSNFSINRDKFAYEAQIQMKRAQDMITYLQDAQKAMESVANWKQREASPRWRANYELIYAQTLAYQARLQEYGWYLAEFVRNPKPIENKFGPSRPTNEWNMTTVKRLLKPEITQPLRDKAEELLRQVVKDHPGTPWAARAEYELRRGYGVELVEGYEDPRYAGGRGINLPKP